MRGHHDGFGLASRPLMLRPLPHRGDVVAAGAVALAALVALLQVRFDDAWDTGIHFVYSAAALALVGTLALRAPREGDAPRAYVSALLAATFALAVLDARPAGAHPRLRRPRLQRHAGLGGRRAGRAGLRPRRRPRLGAVRAARGGEPRPRRPGLRRRGLLARGRHDVPLGAARTRRRLRARHGRHARPPAQARRRAGGRRGADRAGARADLRARSALRLLAALRPRRRHRVGALPLRVRLRAVCLLGGRSRARPGLDRGRRPARHHGDRRRRQGTLVGWPLVLAIGAGGLLVIGLRPSRPLPPDPSRGEAHVFEIRSER